MNIEVELPEFGDAEGDHALVAEWHFEEGDLVMEDDPLVEVTTENESHEIPTPTTGILIDRCVLEEDIVHVGDVLAVIEVEDDEDGPVDLADDFAPDE